MDNLTPDQQTPVGASTTPVQNSTPQVAAPESASLEVTESERLIAAIGYVSFLCLLPLLLKRESNFAQFHGKQALLMAIFWFIVRFVSAFVPILNLIEIIVIVYCMYTAYQGRYFKIPIIGDEAEKLRF